LTYEATMIDKHHKFIQEKKLVWGKELWIWLGFVFKETICFYILFWVCIYKFKISFDCLVVVFFALVKNKLLWWCGGKLEIATNVTILF
jgi:hypothetical protein